MILKIEGSLVRPNAVKMEDDAIKTIARVHKLPEACFSCRGIPENLRQIGKIMRVSFFPRQRLSDFLRWLVSKQKTLYFVGCRGASKLPDALSYLVIPYLENLGPTVCDNQYTAQCPDRLRFSPHIKTRFY